MNLNKLINILDDEFSVIKTNENLVEWAVTKENKSIINPDFLDKKTGLMLKSSDEINTIYTVVFITDTIIAKLTKENQNILLFTHHNFDYYEDKRGLQPISLNNLKKLKENKISIFVAHASLDTHKIYGTSKSLAQLLNIQIDELFFDYFGAPTALIGHINKIDFDSFALHVKEKLEWPYLTLIQNNKFVEMIAVVAGGGDIPDLLLQSHKYGCDTLIGGTIDHKWELPFIQITNKEFHKLNKKLKLSLIGGTHFGTERPAMIYVLDYFKKLQIPAKYYEDENLLMD